MKVNKTACFNTRDAHEARLMAHMNTQGKFSAYVKRLIAQDMAGTLPPPAQHHIHHTLGAHVAPPSAMAAIEAPMIPPRIDTAPAPRVAVPSGDGAADMDASEFC